MLSTLSASLRPNSCSQSLKNNFLLTLFSHRTLSLLRWDLRLLLTRAKNGLLGQGFRIASDLRLRPRPLYLNIGCGPKGLRSPHWINVDAVLDSGVSYALDLTRRMPFPDDCFDGIFCEHVVEHFNEREIEVLLREVRRIARPGSVIRIIVPDGRWILEAYVTQPDSLVSRRFGLASHLDRTAMQAVNSFFRQRYEHQMIYDFETMSLALRRAGFESVEHLRFGLKGGNADLVLDDPSYQPESLYVEAKK